MWKNKITFWEKIPSCSRVKESLQEIDDVEMEIEATKLHSLFYCGEKCGWN